MQKSGLGLNATDKLEKSECIERVKYNLLRTSWWFYPFKVLNQKRTLWKPLCNVINLLKIIRLNRNMQYQWFDTDTSISAWHYPLFWLKFTSWQALNCHSPSHLSVWFSTIQYYSKAYLNPNENPIDKLLLDPLMNIDWKRGPVWSGAPSV